MHVLIVIQQAHTILTNSLYFICLILIHSYSDTNFKVSSFPRRTLCCTVGVLTYDSINFVCFDFGFVWLAGH